MKGLIIGLDFDGTVVKHDFPRIGEDIGAIPVLKSLVSAGHKIVLNTMRSKKDGTLDAAVNWFVENGIPLAGINSAPGQFRWTDSRKAYANIYIDDCGLGIPLLMDEGDTRPYVDWEEVERLLQEIGVL